MKKSCICFITCFCLIMGGCSSKPKGTEMTRKENILEIIYSVADELGMKVMCDMNIIGGGLYHPDDNHDSILTVLKKKSDKHIVAYHEMYGNHPSFWGWYLNNEINPMDSLDYKQAHFWRQLWKSVANKCHAIAPGSKVTISPFFLLDKEEFRGFRYQSPAEYEAWWFNTMKESDIDVLMLQDSGAEHLSFFTLDEREPFLAAAAKACQRAGKEFWVNVETGQVEADNWAEALEMEHNHSREWAFTQIDWLKQKLLLAAKYGTGIINWGYYPFMNPKDEYEAEVDGQKVNADNRKANYEAYKNYIESLTDNIPDGLLVQPKLQGTVWFLEAGMENKDMATLEKELREEITNQRNLGFTYLWICSTSYYFTAEKEK